MSDFWSRALRAPLLYALAALLLWPLVGGTAAAFFLVAACFGQLIYHLVQLNKLAHWLKDPQLATVPQAGGSWGDLFAQLYQIVRRQSKSRHQLSEALARFRRAGEAMPDGVVILDELDEIEWFNPVAARQLGLNLETDAGRPITYLLRQTQFHEYLAAHNYSEPLILKSTRNPELTLSIQLVPFGAKQKLLIARDISRVEQLETVRRDFVANVSHELRTPLTVVGGFLETLLDHADLSAEQRRHYLETMLDQTRRMQRLVDDLLTLSRLESAANPLQEAPVDVPGLIKRLLAEAQSLSRGRHQVRAEVTTDAWLMGSESELESAFGNLISNAVRYTPTGGEVVLRWETAAEGVCFSVRDSGIGIEPQHIPRLTERFYRVDRSRSRETGGTGLGLSIVKHVLTRHQGRLEIQSEVGKGSTFSACFPASRVIARKNLPAAVTPH
ncbi:phosphate regulon sensor histidine kinase PhoR [Thiobacter aerophilum]|uniref:Phosphate regulon sensor protein PhoR n=1 Tax=Thiobacter aerophilum TaxID=3121275 RepID=A0ABV0EIQ6_9BURK